MPPGAPGSPQVTESTDGSRRRLAWAEPGAARARLLALLSLAAALLVLPAMKLDRTSSPTSGYAMLGLALAAAACFADLGAREQVEIDELRVCRVRRLGPWRRTAGIAREAVREVTVVTPAGRSHGGVVIVGGDRRIDVGRGAEAGALPAIALAIQSALEVGFAAAIRQAVESGRRAVLRLSNGAWTTDVSVAEGRILFAASSDPWWRLGEHLVRTGRLGRRQLEEATERCGPGVSIGKTIVDLELLSAAELRDAARDQARDALLAVSRGTGSCETLVLPAASVDLHLDTTALLAEVEAASAATAAGPGDGDVGAPRTPQPPRDRHDASGWDRYWHAELQPPHRQFLGFGDFMASSPDLLALLQRAGCRSVLCAGNGLSLEPFALAAAGLEVTVLELSGFATALTRMRSPGPSRMHLADSRAVPAPGGSGIRVVTGSLFDAAACPGPFDVVIERRTCQLFEPADQGLALDRLAARLGNPGVLVSHQHMGWWRPGEPRDHFAEQWADARGFSREIPAPGTPRPPRLAWLQVTTG